MNIALLRRRGQVRKKARKIPKQKLPGGARLRYLTYLRRRHRTLAAVVDGIVAALPGHLAQRDMELGILRQDAVTADILRIFDDARLFIARELPDAEARQEISQVAHEIDTNSAGQHQRQMRAGLGIDVIVPEPFRAPALEMFLAENQALVKNMTNASLERFRATVSRGVTAGLRVETIRDQLMHELDISKSRASLLARDQTLKFHGNLTELRQKNAGIKEYDWNTSGDGRVRESHSALHGTRQQWAKPPVVSTGSKKSPTRRAHPGQDYQCRCQAIPVIPEDLLAPTEEPSAAPRSPGGETVPLDVTEKQAHEYVNRWTATHTSEEEGAMKLWKTHGYGEMRKASLDPSYRGSLGAHKRLPAFREALRRAPLWKGPMHRGVSYVDPDNLAKLKKGAIVEERAPSSWSLDRRVAANFAATGDAEYKDVLFSLKKSAGGAMITAESEKEVVQVGRKYKVLKRRQDPKMKNRILIDLEEI